MSVLATPGGAQLTKKMTTANKKCMMAFFNTLSRHLPSILAERSASTARDAVMEDMQMLTCEFKNDDFDAIRVNALMLYDRAADDRGCAWKVMLRVVNNASNCTTATMDCMYTLNNIASLSEIRLFEYDINGGDIDYNATMQLPFTAYDAVDITVKFKK